LDLENARNFQFYKSDVTDLKRTENILKGIQVIIHLAAYKIPRFGDRLDTLIVNTQGTQNILEVAKRNKAKVLFVSTSDVYGKNQQLPFKEDADSVLGPPDVARWSYAVSKIFDEQLCFAYWEKYKVPFVILRLFNVYGPRQNRNWLGGPQSQFIDAILKNMPVEIHGTGMQTRCFTYIDDIVDGIIKSIGETKALTQVINLGSSREITILKFARLIAKLSEKPLRIKRITYKSFTGKVYQDVIKRRPQISKAKRILNWLPKTGLEEGLMKTIEWHKANPL